jgi:uncharacterized membrane protein YdjX (TVP38/TMEM64 family)
VSNRFKLPADKHQLYTGILGVGILVILGVSLTLVFRTVGADKIQEIIKSSGIWGPLIFILFHIATIMISPTGGGSLLIVSSGALFGLIPGLIYSLVSALAGASINFWVAKVFGQKVVTRIISKKNYNHLEFARKTLNNLNPILLVPIFSSAAFNMLCYIAGLTNIKYSKFITTVLISSSINIPVYVAIGSSLIDSKDNVPRLILPFVIGIAVVAFIIEEIMRRRSKKILEFTNQIK